jgi:hypothetical protein
MKSIILILLLSLSNTLLKAATGDTIKVVSHQNVIMTTDTFGSGATEKRRWIQAPASSIGYRKVFVRMSYKCPGGLACGEWDYIDAVKLRRTGGVNGVDQQIELIRFITPYGNSFSSSWGFTWYADITDFSTLLHDSCEIGYYHSGYETYVGRGWDVTIEFNFVEGSPAWVPLKVTKLWNGGFPYGNVNNPIENYLQPVNISTQSFTDFAVIRIHQTGHGADDNYCSEFCYRTRYLKWDATQIDETLLWRKCGFNALFPQAGTWIYDRGNWCPGATVYPYRKEVSAGSNETHTVDIDMQSYISGNPSANEVIESYLIEFKEGIQTNDAGIDEIIRPTIHSEYGRINPICDNPVVIVKNNGKNAITSLTFDFGYLGQNSFNYTWSGNIPVRGIDTIMLPQVVLATAASQMFQVTISKVNNSTDPYVYDNTAVSRGNVPLGIAESEKVYLELKTNNNPEENSYKLTDSYGNILYQRAQGSLTANTVYKDTFDLPYGCYTLVIKDINDYGGDGLSWWANQAAGSGYARLRKIPGNVIFRNWGGDWGADARISFTVGNVVSNVVSENSITSFQLFPNPANNLLYADVLFNKPTDYTIIITDLLGQKISEQSFYGTYGNTHNISTETLMNGYYLLQVVSKDNVQSKTFIVVH